MYVLTPNEFVKAASSWELYQSLHRSTLTAPTLQQAPHESWDLRRVSSQLAGWLAGSLAGWLAGWLAHATACLGTKISAVCVAGVVGWLVGWHLLLHLGK